MADQHRVVAPIVQIAIYRIANRNRLQTSAAVEAKGRGVGERQVTLSRWFQLLRHHYAPATVAVCFLAVATCNACSRSAMMSRTSSIPTESRINSGVTPVSRCSASESCWCVVEDGWITSDLASPMFARRLKSFTELMNFLPAS